MTPERKKKLYRWVAFAGVLLSLACKHLPPAYQAPCEFLSSICSR